MKKSVIFLLLFVCVFSNAQTTSLKSSPGLNYGQAIKVGISPQRLARIDSMINQAIVADEIPGAVVLVARKGKIVYHKAFGMSDHASGRSMNKDAIFRIASQTKAITATALMMLWEEGRFQLDDPISKYIPEFKNVTVLDSFIEADSSFIGKPAKIRSPSVNC